MDYTKELALSFYHPIATLNESHQITLVQHRETNRIYVKKILSVYNIDIYRELFAHPIPGIPRIIEYHECNNQLIVIENFISGHSLEELMENEPIDLQTLLRYFLELCSILEKLHGMTPPIVHRDIKPSNIIITEYGHVVLIDFNAAKYFSDASESDTVLLGTKGYAAPEQYGFGSSSPKTDIYAMGILLKEMSALLSEPPRRLSKIIEKCTELAPGDRYASITDLKNALQNISRSAISEEDSLASHTSLLPPGFRTHSIAHMLLAVPAYLFIFYLSFTLKVENIHGAALWAERACCLLLFLALIAGTFNYRNIQQCIPLCKSRNRLVRYLGVILLDCILVVLVLFLLVMLVGILTSV